LIQFLSFEKEKEKKEKERMYSFHDKDKEKYGLILSYKQKINQRTLL
jgi:hypothetical protein